MKKTYADECLERAKLVTEGPWETYKTYDASFADGIRQQQTKEDIICGSIDYEQQGVFMQADADFIANSRTDVPELARRLKKALKAIHESNDNCMNCGWEDLIQELEAPLEDK